MSTRLPGLPRLLTAPPRAPRGGRTPGPQGLLNPGCGGAAGLASRLDVGAGALSLSVPAPVPSVPPGPAGPGPAERRPRCYGDPRAASRPPQPPPLLIGSDSPQYRPIAADSRQCPALPALR